MEDCKDGIFESEEEKGCARRRAAAAVESLPRGERERDGEKLRERARGREI